MKAEIIKRVNLAFNYWADTVGVDYCEVLTYKEVLAEDARNREQLFLFRKELTACGY